MNQTANTGTQHPTPTPASGSVAPKRARVKPEIGHAARGAAPTASAAPAWPNIDNDPELYAVAIKAIERLNGRLPSGFDEVDVLNLANGILARYETLPAPAHRAGAVRHAVGRALRKIIERARAKKALKFVAPKPDDADADGAAGNLIDWSAFQNWAEAERLSDMGDALRRFLEKIGRDPALDDVRAVVAGALAVDGAGAKVTQKAIKAKTGISQPTVSRRIEEAREIFEGMDP